MAIGIAVVGAVVGSAFGQASLGWLIGSAIGSALFRKTERVYSPMAPELRVNGTEYGQDIPFAQGAVAVAGQIWWMSARRAIAHTTTSGGGKGGAPKVETTTYTYEIDVLYGLTDNEIDAVSRVWVNGELAYNTLDARSLAFLSGSTDVAAFEAQATQNALNSANTSAWRRMTVYTGAADQLPDPVYEAAVGAQNAPAYRGRGTVFIEGLNLGTSGQMPNIVFEVLSSASRTSLGTWNPNDATRGVSFSNGNATVSFAAGLTGMQVRSTAKGLIGKRYYCEFQIGSVGSWIGVGFVKDTAPLTHQRDFNLHGTCAIYPRSGGIGATANLTKNQTGAGAFFAGDVIMLALDLVAGKAWFGKNGVWINGGDPASGVNPQITGIPANTRFGLYAIADGSAQVTLNCGPAFTYALPDGYEPEIRNAPPAPFVRYVRWKDFVVPGTNGMSLSELRLLSGGIDVTPSGAQCSYLANGSHPEGGQIDPTVRLADGNLSTAQTWTMLRQTNLPDFYIKYDLGADVAVDIDGWKFGEGWGDIYFADSVRVEGSYDDLIYFTLGEESGILQLSGNSYSAVYPLDTSAGAGLAGGGSGGFETVGYQDETLQDVVSRLCLRAGLAQQQFDVSLLAAVSKPVRSLVAGLRPTREVLEALMTSHFFDAVVGQAIKFVPRGGSPVLSVPYDDLGSSAGDSEVDALPLRIASEIEIPAQIALTYPNVLGDYEPDTQYSDRILSAAETVQPVSLQVGLLPQEAKAAADSMLGDLIVSRASAQIALPGRYAALEPTDVVTIADRDGTSYRMRITRLVDEYPLLRFELVMDDASVLTDTVPTASGQTTSISVPAAVGTRLALLDIPILRDADNDPGFYVAARGEASPWPGCQVMRSVDDLEFSSVAAVAESAVMGETVDALDDWDGPRIFDETGSVTVDLGYGTAESSTRAALLADPLENAWLIGDEVVQVRDVELVSTNPNVYRFRGLLRGGRGTEWAMTGHTAGERAVRLRPAGMRRVRDDASLLGVTRYYRGVTSGRSLASASSVSFANQGAGLRPFSPFAVRIERGGSGDITIRWQRRTRLSYRIGGSLGVYIPLGESAEAYEVEIYDTATPPALKRTIATSQPEAIYTAAQQSADGFSPGAPIRVIVYQMSSAVGRGYPSEAKVA